MTERDTVSAVRASNVSSASLSLPATSSPDLTMRTRTILRLCGGVGGQLACLAEVMYPFEACGLLIGRRQGNTIEVQDVEQARTCDAYHLLDRHAVLPQTPRGDGLHVVGTWRSRPNASAEPTPRELDAVGRGYSFLLISVFPLGKTEFRSWRRVGKALQEESLSPSGPLRA